MAATTMTIKFEIKVRPWWQRLIMFPWVWRGHYMTLRRHGNGVWLSMYGSWILAGVILKPVRMG